MCHLHLTGIAIELESGIIFPAEFPWNNFEDFSTQLKDRVSRRTGGGALLGDEDKHKTKLSTFKPKALRNHMVKSLFGLLPLYTRIKKRL